MESLTLMDSLVRAYEEVKVEHAAKERALLDALSHTNMSSALFAALREERTRFDSLTAAAEEATALLEARAAVRGPTQWTRKALAKQCGLLVDERRLAETLSDRTVERVNWGEVVKLRTTLADLRNRADMNAKQRRFLEGIEGEFHRANFDRRDLRRVADALALKLSEEIDSLTMTNDVTKHAQAVADLTPDLANCEHLLEVALENGDVALAEDIADNQIKLYEKLLQVTEEQYPMLQAKKDQTREFVRRRRWAIFRMANKDINGVVESKFRHIEACEDDMQRLRDFLQAESGKDRDGRERFRQTMADSDAYLQRNKENQEDTFAELTDLYNRVRECEQRLQNLGNTRRSEIARRTELIEAEAARTHDYRMLVATSDEYAALLQGAIRGAEQVREVCKQLNDFLLDGCDNITAKFERSEANMNSMIATTNKQYLKLFSGYAVAVGRLRYRKEMRRRQVRNRMKESEMLLEFANEVFDPLAKKHADDRTDASERSDALGHEIEALTEKLEATGRRFEPCARSLRDSGVSFIHPLELAQKVNVERQATVVEFREIMNVTERKIEDQIARDVAAVQNDIDTNRLNMMRKQAATHLRHAHQAMAKAPRPPMSATERFQAASFSRYKQLIAELNRPADSSATDQQLLTDGKPTSALSTNGRPANSARPGTAPVGRPSAAVTQATAVPPPPAAVATSLPSHLEGATVVALYSYKSRAADELTFSKGDRIVCIGPGSEPGWYLGVCNQRTGLYPLNYVSLPTGEDALLDVD